MPADSQTWVAKVLIAMARPIVRLIYKVQVEGLENMPKTGGVLVAPNHLSYLDVVLLAVTSPRPLRMMAWSGFTKYAFFRAIFRIFGVLPVSPDNARASLKDATKLLQEGAAVVIFPEGQISRTGELQPIAGGFNLLARHSGAPVVPVHLAGVWGSIFSFERGKFFWKKPLRIPYPVTLRFGPPLPADQATVEHLREALVALGKPTDPVNAPTVKAPPSAPPAPAATPKPANHPPGAALLD
ncbi:MAG TPA: 1-acyl-sn-glycerol-3-phosphate acyltransferase, partial [Opitutales bacterium]|nr:1-acyl-sn-glycerol-3-phosphate acyltransferase [Opitutales bacterium]